MKLSKEKVMEPETPFTRLYEDRFGLAPDFPAPAEMNPALAAILARRSHRRFRPDPVAPDLLRTLLACAQSAPAKSDLQQYAIIAIRDAALRTQMNALLASQPWVVGAPVMLVFCGDFRRGQRVTALRGLAHANNNMDSFMNAAVDAALAMQSFILAAEAAGLGCCPLSVIRNRIEEVSAALGLPDGVFPVACLCVGWPAAAGFTTLRLPPALVVHEDRYDDGDLEAELTAYDTRRHKRFPITPDKQLHLEHYGQAETYHWSHNAARRLSRPERAGFRDFLLKHGFKLA
ncbi:MAG: NADPH-dependent oxidoreductase [Alphaproteobacteria bacterium]|nr:NADPH-dependent oxidoreductase [Alphaproteobacteria bacterium]